MSIEVRYADGVFRPIEEVKDAAPDKVYRVFSEEELRSLSEDVRWLKAAEKSFAFWENEEDAVYDRL
jgi:predicted DNA-binding antitoxin AbrB/MazE fold protein